MHKSEEKKNDEQLLAVQPASARRPVKQYTSMFTNQAAYTSRSYKEDQALDSFKRATSIKPSICSGEQMEDDIVRMTSCFSDIMSAESQNE